MNACATGLEFCSREWFDSCATQVPEPWHPIVLELTRMYGSNSTDPNAIARVITEGLREGGYVLAKVVKK